MLRLFDVLLRNKIIADLLEIERIDFYPLRQSLFLIANRVRNVSPETEYPLYNSMNGLPILRL